MRLRRHLRWVVAVETAVPADPVCRDHGVLPTLTMVLIFQPAEPTIDIQPNKQKAAERRLFFCIAPDENRVVHFALSLTEQTKGITA